MTSYVRSVLSVVSSALDLNAATLSGAIDIIVFQDEAGDLHSTNWHVRFGKLRLLKSRQKVKRSPAHKANLRRSDRCLLFCLIRPQVVRVEVNGELHDEIRMRLGAEGEAYFTEECDAKPPDEVCASPSSLSSSPKLITYEDEPVAGPDIEEEDVADPESQKGQGTLAVSYLSDSEIESQKKSRSYVRVASLEAIGRAYHSSSQDESKWPIHEDTVNASDRVVPRAKAKVDANVEAADTIESDSAGAAQNSKDLREGEEGVDDKQPPVLAPLELPPPAIPIEENTTNSDIRLDTDGMEAGIAGELGSLGGDQPVEASGDSSCPPVRSGSGEYTGTENGQHKKSNLVEEEAELDNRHSEVQLEEQPQVLSMSLCGHLINADMTEDKISEVFEENRVDYEEFSRSPSILTDPNMLIRLGDRLVHWEIAAPMIVSMLAFGLPLDIGKLEKPEVADGYAAHDQDEHDKVESPRYGWFRFTSKKKESTAIVSRPVPGGLALREPSATKKRQKHARKSLRPTNKILKNLNLRPGRNTVRFLVYSSLQGQQEVHSNIFLWPMDQKIVISDVDGTITKSDVLGHVLPRMGRDWSHSGVTELFHKLISLGYNIIYLTSRPIGQADNTRAYLKNLVQGEVGLPIGPVVMSPDRMIRSITREVILRRPHEFKIAVLREIRLLFPPDFNPFYAGFGNRSTDIISYGAVGIPPQRIFTINPKGELNVMNANYEACGSYSDLEKFLRSVFPDMRGVRGQKSINEALEYQEFSNFSYWKPALPEVDVSDLL
uniref:phosphatidate phosphatase n=4 Tax=Rhodosorus marinus TaxID=101924 RepID=A0A7S3ABA7_9RHOD|mmetsp:Transcript_8674/g.38594  ORF Transcript_8674/g.38594 Transcript_8674/m.38594 type:complete len:776 (+) Transcript_8674:416-2743(+)